MKAFGALIVVVILAGAAYLGYQTLSAPKPAAQPAAATQTPTQTAKNASSFDQKVDDFESQLKSGSNQPVSLELTQDEVNAKVAQELAAAPAGEVPVQNVAVKLQQDTAVVTGVANLGGQQVPIEAQVKPTANGGMLDLNVTSVKAAGIAVPDAVKNQLIQQAQSAMGGQDLSKLDVGIDLKSVQLSNGQVQINGQTR